MSTPQDDRQKAQGPAGPHWERVYRETAPARVSWFQREPSLSLELIRRAGTRANEPLIDIGAGSSILADRLLDAGYTDLTLLDVSERALETTRARLGERAGGVQWIAADLLRWTPRRHYALWHDRAMFHFLTGEAERAAYLVRLRAALRIGGHAVIASFSPRGPERCSGLPVQRYSPESLAQTLGHDFELVESHEDEHVTPAGRSQWFQYSLLRRNEGGPGIAASGRRTGEGAR